MNDWKARAEREMDELESTRPADEDRCGGRNTLTRRADADYCTPFRCTAGARTGSRCIGSIRPEVVKHRDADGHLSERVAMVCNRCGQAYGPATLISHD